MARKIEARIDLTALRHNLACVRRLAPGSRVLAMVKADAYGHGARVVLEALAGADALAVAHIDEALELRAHTRQPIVVLEGFLDEAEWRQCLAGDQHVVRADRRALRPQPSPDLARGFGIAAREIERHQVQEQLIEAAPIVFGPRALGGTEVELMSDDRGGDRGAARLRQQAR